MYLENEKISQRQVKRLVVFNLLSVSGLILPRIAVAAAGRDGMLSIILGFIFALLYVLFIVYISKFIDGDFMNFTKEKGGRVLAFLIGFLYLIKFFVCLVFAVRLFGQVISETLLKDTDVRIIILLLLLISAYAVSKGFEVRARITEFLYFIVLIPLGIFIILGIKNINITNLFPLLTNPANKIIYGGYTVFVTFSALEFLLFSFHFIQDKEDKRNKKSNFHYLISGVILAGLINLFLYVITVGIIGVTDTKAKLWSTINMIQLVDLSGGFLQRHDALIISIWMLSIFTLTSGFLYYLCMISKEMFHPTSQNYMIIPFILLLFPASIVPMDTELYYWYFEKYMIYIGCPQSILIPLLVVFIGWIRKRSHNVKNTGKITKGILLILLIPSLFSLTACTDMTEIEDRNFIQAIGVDYNNGEIILTLASPDLPSYTEQGSSDEEEKAKLLSQFTGKDFYRMEEEYYLSSNKRIDFSHLKAIIFGKEVLENEEVYNEFLQYVENRYEITRNTLVFLSDTSAQEIININSKIEDGVGNYLNELYRINVLNNGREEMKLKDLIHSKNDGTMVSKVPILTIHEESLVIKGAAFIKDSSFAYEVDEEDLGIINILRGYGKNSRLFIKDENEDVKYVLKINKINKSVECQSIEDKPFITLRIEGDGLLEKGLDYEKKEYDLEDKIRKAQINKETNQYIQKRIIEYIEKISKEESVDFMNLYRESYRKKDIWLKYKDKEDEFLKDLSYEIIVDIGL